MKKVFLWISLSALGFSFSANKEREDILPYAPAAEEVYPSDTILSKCTRKRAMILIAHDDDMCAMSGTIALLNQRGWDIKVLSFPKGKKRDRAQIKACRAILDTVAFYRLEYSQWRKDYKKGEQLPLYIPKQQFSQTFDSGMVAREIINQFQSFRPEVLFTLDNEVGGYGHAEHVFISQLALDLATAKKITPTYIYQSVFTPHMTNSIMERHSRRMKSWGFAGDGWEKAKATYNVEGMPLPNVQVSITDVAGEKMNYLRSYNTRERKTIGFFIPAFEEYSPQEYFKIFDREFFRVIPFH
jgi:LmbE family N-acetylglucosaminyl deacetylase